MTKHIKQTSVLIVPEGATEIATSRKVEVTGGDDSSVCVDLERWSYDNHDIVLEIKAPLGPQIKDGLAFDIPLAGALDTIERLAYALLHASAEARRLGLDQPHPLPGIAS